MRPPGTAKSSELRSASRLTIRLRIGVQWILPSASLVTTPGRISISCPSWSSKTRQLCGPAGKAQQALTLKTPCNRLPPATPPFSSSTSAPGLLTSKDRMTVSRGSALKSRRGTGIVLVMYSLTASMLYLSWADIGTIGAASATVPTENSASAGRPNKRTARRANL